MSGNLFGPEPQTRAAVIRTPWVALDITVTLAINLALELTSNDGHSTHREDLVAASGRRYRTVGLLAAREVIREIEGLARDSASIT